MERSKMIIRAIYNLVRDGWKSINSEQKLSMVGIIVGMVMITYAFRSEYGLHIVK